MGNINENLNLILPPPDVSTLIIFINILLFSSKNGRNYFFQSTWVDKLLFLYLLCVLLIPGLINLFIFSVPLTYKFFIPLRYWFVYRNFYCYYKENQIRQNKLNITKLIQSTLMIVGLISALISMSRFFTLPGGDFIEDLWPVYYEKKQIKMIDWGRMVGTMSDTNGAGNYFCFLSIISFSNFDKKNKYSFIYSLIFAISVILTGSFSSISALIFSIAYYFKKQLLSKKFIGILIIGLTTFLIVTNIEVLNERINKRINVGYKSGKGNSILPSNLQARIGYWENFTKILLEEDRIFFGLGPGGFFNYKYGKNNVVNQNAESFYFRIINESGIFSLIFVIIFFITIIKHLQRLMKNNPNNDLSKIIFIIVLSYLIAGVANETLYYGSNASLFGIILSLIVYQEYNSVLEKKKQQLKHT